MFCGKRVNLYDVFCLEYRSMNNDRDALAILKYFFSTIKGVPVQIFYLQILKKINFQRLKTLFVSI